MNLWGYGLAALVLVTTTVRGNMWNDQNCPNGKVVDAICCNDDACPAVKSESDCSANHLCLWKDGKCTENRDAANNVCCKSDTNPLCGGISAGVCPDIFTVPSGCCSKEGLKYDKILKVAKPGYVCCNTPCQDAKELKCDEPPRCNQPTGKSYGLGGVHDFGFKRGLLDGVDYKIGSVLPSLHFPYHGGLHHPGDYFPSHSLHDTDYSRDKHVDEITVDDIMNSLIDALSNDKDVFTYNREITSDPYFRKQSFGGLVDTFNYINPHYFLDDIYSLPNVYGYGKHHGGYGSSYYGYGGGRYGHSLGGYGGGYGHGDNHYGHSGYGHGDHYGSSYGYGGDHHGYGGGYGSHGYSSHKKYNTHHGYGSSGKGKKSHSKEDY